MKDTLSFKDRAFWCLMVNYLVAMFNCQMIALIAALWLAQSYVPT